MKCRCRRNRRPPVRAVRARALQRYNVLVEDRQARHIGDIIRERNNSAAHGLAAESGHEQDAVSRVLKTLRLVFVAVLDVLATIGWFVTLPFITADGRELTARGQSRG